MERKDLTPSEEMLFNVYNNNHKTKIELEKVRNIDIKNKKLYIEYFNENTLLGYSTATMDITLTDDEVVEQDHRKYHRAIELAAQAVNYATSLFGDFSVSPQDISNLNCIYNSYVKLLDNYVETTVREVSDGLVDVDTAYEDIFYASGYVSFHDLNGYAHKVKFEWFLQPDFLELKEYFTNYKKTDRREKIYKCRDDIETFKRLIAEREEELKQLENEEDQNLVLFYFIIVQWLTNLAYCAMIEHVKRGNRLYGNSFCDVDWGIICNSFSNTSWYSRRT